MTKTIYVVTRGEYSDYDIEALFSEVENAEQFVKYYNATNRYDEARIEERELDAISEYSPKGMNFYSVVMDRNGDADEPHIQSWMDTPYVSHMWHARKGEWLHMTVAARDKEHAIKIVNEKRAQLIATEQWDALK